MPALQLYFFAFALSQGTLSKPLVDVEAPRMRQPHGYSAGRKSLCMERSGVFYCWF